MTVTGATDERLRGSRGVLALMLVLGCGHLPDGLARRGVDLAARIAPFEGDPQPLAPVTELPRQRRGSGIGSRQPVA